MLLYGAPGVMKSFLVEYMAFCIATGTEFLEMRVEQARTLLVNFEISPYGYFWRLRDMAGNFAGQDNMLFELSPGTLYLEEQETFNVFSAIVRPIQPKVIILDCLQACYGGEENSSEEISNFIRNVKGLAAEHTASLVIVHHANKNPLATGSMDRSRGHSKLPGSVDTVIYMVEQPSGVQLQFAKARQAPRRLHNLNVQFENFMWSIRH